MPKSNRLPADGLEPGIGYNTMACGIGVDRLRAKGVRRLIFQLPLKYIVRSNMQGIKLFGHLANNSNLLTQSLKDGCPLAVRVIFLADVEGFH